MRNVNYLANRAFSYLHQYFFPNQCLRWLSTLSLPQDDTNAIQCWLVCLIKLSINPSWCRKWLTVFIRKAKARSTYHLPRKNCSWLPVKYMNFKTYLWYAVLNFAWSHYSLYHFFLMFLNVFDSHLSNHSSWCPFAELNLVQWQWAGGNTSRESTFIRKWRKKGRTENNQAPALDLGCRVAPKSCCPTTQLAS